MKVIKVLALAYFSIILLKAEIHLDEANCKSKVTFSKMIRLGDADVQNLFHTQFESDDPKKYETRINRLPPATQPPQPRCELDSQTAS